MACLAGSRFDGFAARFSHHPIPGPTLAEPIAQGHDIRGLFPAAPSKGVAWKLSPARCIACRHRQARRPHPLSLKNTEDRWLSAALDLDAAVVVAYGLILPKPFWTRRVWAVSICTLAVAAGAAPPHPARVMAVMLRLA